MFKDISTDKKLNPLKLNLNFKWLPVIHFSSTLNFNIDEESKAESLKTKKMCGVIKTFILTISSCFSDRNDIETEATNPRALHFIFPSSHYITCALLQNPEQRDVKALQLNFPFHRCLNRRVMSPWLKRVCEWSTWAGLWRERS